MGFSFFEALERVSFGSAGFEEWMARLMTRYLCTMEVIFLKRTCRRMREIVDQMSEAWEIVLNLEECMVKGNIAIYKYMEENDSWRGWFKRDRGHINYVEAIEGRSLILPEKDTFRNTMWLYENFYLSQKAIVINAFYSGDTTLLDYVLRNQWITVDGDPETCIYGFGECDDLERFSILTTYFPLDDPKTQSLFTNKYSWYSILSNPQVLGWALLHQHLDFWNFGLMVLRSAGDRFSCMSSIIKGARMNPDARQREMLMIIMLFIESSHPKCVRLKTGFDLFQSDPRYCKLIGRSMMQFVEYDECCCENPENHRLKKRKI